LLDKGDGGEDAGEVVEVLAAGDTTLEVGRLQQSGKCDRTETKCRR
jgi:hypothetical protein